MTLISQILLFVKSMSISESVDINKKTPQLQGGAVFHNKKQQTFFHPDYTVGRGIPRLAIVPPAAGRRRVTVSAPTVTSEVVDFNSLLPLTKGELEGVSPPVGNRHSCRPGHYDPPIAESVIRDRIINISPCPEGLPG